MNWADGFGWMNVGADNQVREGPCLLAGLVVLASVTGGDVTLYEGNDASSGRKIGKFEGVANVSNPIMFSPPLPLQRGLFVDVGSNITEVAVLFKPVHEPE